ncbi:LIC_10190 family membrane protein [Halpernia frigidisoli]|uniref:DUF8201 domain-containing protein n=1 Tax=Halpernia frigidisoli TaxID=1125876 RepID=A0A1I3D0F3_9FLAO|nr:hypothetical protein [Halpernia frigidisoli]SFH80250.1 hypothetical protein SAMN05443292_0188 [Halpernia frigidisoli]
MLYILFSIIVLLPVFSGFGALCGKILSAKIIKLSSKLIAGISSLSLLLITLAFFIPLNIYVEIPVLGIGFISFFYFKIYKEFYDLLKWNYKIFFIFLIIIIFSASFYPFILDHFGYYVPTIKWLSEIGLVKGISNLDLLLGQMSFWHFLQAGFSNFSDIYLRLNAVLMVVYLIYILENKSWFHLLFFPVLLLFTQSPSPDLPAIVFSLIILNKILEVNKNANLIFAFSIFVFAIKPTMIWVPIITLLYSIFILKSNVKFLFFGLMIFCLFILKNLYTFGFPIFPVSVFDLNLSWRPNAQLLKISSEVAIQKTFDMQFSISQINQFSTFDHIKNWLFLDGIKSFIHLCLIALLTIFTFFVFKKNKKIIYFIWISILVKIILILLFSAQYRFFIDVFFVIFFIIFYQIFSKKLILLTTSILVIFSFLFLSFPQIIKNNVPSFKLGNYMLGISKDQWIKPAYFKLNNYKTYKIGNLKFNIVKNYPFSFDTPIPSISPEYLKEDLNAGIFPQMITNNIKDGFIWKKLSVENERKLRKIVKDPGY